MHKWAATLMIAAMILHQMRVYFTGAYRRPRELNWMIGMSLLMCTQLNRPEHTWYEEMKTTLKNGSAVGKWRGSVSRHVPMIAVQGRIQWQFRILLSQALVPE